VAAPPVPDDRGCRRRVRHGGCMASPRAISNSKSASWRSRSSPRRCIHDLALAPRTLWRMPSRRHGPARLVYVARTQEHRAPAVWMHKLVPIDASTTAPSCSAISSAASACSETRRVQLSRSCRGCDGLFCKTLIPAAKQPNIHGSKACRLTRPQLPEVNRTRSRRSRNPFADGDVVTTSDHRLRRDWKAVRATTRGALPTPESERGPP
jgi:hypothetical protein